MLIRLGYDLEFQVPAPTPLLLLLYVHPSQAISLLEPDRVHVEPDTSVREFTDSFGNRCSWLTARPGRLRLWNTTLIEVSTSWMVETISPSFLRTSRDAFLIRRVYV